MTQLIFKNDIDRRKMDVLLGLKKAPLTLSVGMWAGRDIDDKQLRVRAWGTSKR
jgi:hypothetical protein